MCVYMIECVWLMWFTRRRQRDHLENIRRLLEKLYLYGKYSRCNSVFFNTAFKPLENGGIKKDIFKMWFQIYLLFEISKFCSFKCFMLII